LLLLYSKLPGRSGKETDKVLAIHDAKKKNSEHTLQQATSATIAAVEAWPAAGATIVV